MVLSLLAEQNIDIIEGLDTLNRDTKNSSMEFAGIMESCFLAVGEDIKYALNANQAAIADLSVKLDTKFKELDDKIKDGIECNVKDKNEKTKPAPTTDLDDKIEVEKVEKEKEIAVKKKKTSYLLKPRILYVGDSIAHNVEMKDLEEKTHSRLTSRKAFSSIHDKRAKFPSQNVKDVSGKTLDEAKDDDKYEYVVFFSTNSRHNQHRHIQNSTI